jgi:hypothetical protein
MRSDELKLLSDLIAGLLAATSSGQLDWQEVGSSTYGVRAPSGQVLVGSAQPSGKHPYTFVLRNDDDQVVEELTTVPGSFYHPWETRLESLYGEARTKVRNINGVVQNIKAELQLPDFDVPAVESEE